jgi:DnaJ-class molecular chaperone
MAKTSTVVSTSDEIESDGEVPRAEPSLSFQECPECCGLGRITCPACDGTGLWTEASESAGNHQREAARASGHCAWCNEWGEAECTMCAGNGFVQKRNGI